MVTYPDLCNVPNPAPAPLALDPGDKPPYFEILQHVLALAYRWFNAFNKMFAGGNAKGCQRYLTKIEPRVSVDCNGVITTLYTGDAGELMIQGEAGPVDLCHMGNIAGEGMTKDHC